MVELVEQVNITMESTELQIQAVEQVVHQVLILLVLVVQVVQV